MPVTLSYHSGSVRPNQHPGWVGLGWNLNSFGTIHRNVKGLIDELGGETSLYTTVPYYPNPASASNTSGSQIIESTANWYTPANLYDYFSVTNNDIYSPDVQADEFSFNFYGHSGKFYYAGPVKGWEVISDENIKVEVDGFLSPLQILDLINEYNPVFNLGGSHVNYQARMFKGFTLTVENGTKYIFGGTNAVEFSSPYGAESFTGVRADTWLLKKIVDSNGREVNLQYSRDYVNCNLYYTVSSSSYSCKDISNGPAGTGSEGNVSGSVNPNDLMGSYIFPMYLTSITSDTETITFRSSVATTLRYTDLQLNKWSTAAANLTLIDKNINLLQWKKLDQINVSSNFNNSSGNSYKNYYLNYNQSTTERFSLNGLTQTSNGPEIKNYGFFYDNIASMPPYSGNRTDHWGFGNNIDFTANPTLSTFDKKVTNPLYATKGLLIKMKYPTGGYSTFTWETHQHSRVVPPSRIGLIPYTGYAGGSRIASIKNYTSTDLLANEKKYYYLNGYTSTANLSALTSSGVLNGKPQYSFSATDRLSANGNLKISYTINQLNSVANYNFNGNGSHIGYDEVTEVNSDGSYTKHYFTNYGTDKNGITHDDQSPAGKLGWIQGDDAYMPFSSLELERGKTTGTYYYKPDNTLLKKNVITYRNDTARFDDFGKQIIRNFSVGSCNSSDALMFVAAIKNFRYNYYPIQNTTTTYDGNGSNPVVFTKNFTYNSKNQLASETSSTSGSTSLKSNFYYPQDTQAANLPYAADLVSANRIDTPLKTENYRGNDKIAEKITVYDKNATTLQILPKNEYSAKFPNTLTSITIPPVGQLENKITYNQYDTKGNILQYTAENGIPVSLIWGYNQTVPVAKIENAVYSSITPAMITTIQTASNSNIEANLLTELNSLRNSLPNAMVTTYTYAPLKGISSITDPKGNKTSYSYDAFGNLQTVKDNGGNIISENAYHFKR
nr:RHS repeat domain-containing protein [uncultured Flavobacterium sp.]